MLFRLLDRRGSVPPWSRGSEVGASRIRWRPNRRAPVRGPQPGLPALTLGGAGARTITLVATDPEGLADTTTVDITVNDCGGIRPPDTWFIFDTPQDFDDSSCDAAFDEPGYSI
ncbi:MAG: hypothetical protein ACODAE_00920 [Gemmatimonadota bacterium]